MTGKIRFANPGDAEAILGIYAPYIEKTAQRFFRSAKGYYPHR